MRQRGFVLVTVMWVLAIMTVLIIGFGFRARLDARAASYTTDQANAMALARGAVERGIAELHNRSALNAYLGLGERLYFDPRWHGPVDLKREGAYPSLKGAEYAGEICHYTIADAERYLSINHVPKPVLEEVEGLSFTTVRRILRRRGLVEGGGDEPEAPFLAVEEVRYLKGVNDKAWMGHGDVAGLRDLLTVWGDGLINVNTAPAEVLAAIPDVQQGVVDEIVAYRAGGDGKLHTRDDRVFYSMDQLISAIEMSRETLSEVTRYCKVDSRFFTITGFGTLRQGKVRAMCRATIEVRAGGADILAWREGGIASAL